MGQAKNRTKINIVNKVCCFVLVLLFCFSACLLSACDIDPEGSPYYLAILSKTDSYDDEGFFYESAVGDSDSNNSIGSMICAGLLNNFSVPPVDRVVRDYSKLLGLTGLNDNAKEQIQQELSVMRYVTYFSVGDGDGYGNKVVCLSYSSDYTKGKINDLISYSGDVFTVNSTTLDDFMGNSYKNKQLTKNKVYRIKDGKVANGNLCYLFLGTQVGENFIFSNFSDAQTSINEKLYGVGDASLFGEKSTYYCSMQSNLYSPTLTDGLTSDMICKRWNFAFTPTDTTYAYTSYAEESIFFKYYQNSSIMQQNTTYLYQYKRYFVEDLMITMLRSGCNEKGIDLSKVETTWNGEKTNLLALCNRNLSYIRRRPMPISGDSNYFDKKDNDMPLRKKIIILFSKIWDLADTSTVDYFVDNDFKNYIINFDNFNYNNRFDYDRHFGNKIKEIIKYCIKDYANRTAEDATIEHMTYDKYVKKLEENKGEDENGNEIILSGKNTYLLNSIILQSYREKEEDRKTNPELNSITIIFDYDRTEINKNILSKYKIILRYLTTDSTTPTDVVLNSPDSNGDMKFDMEGFMEGFVYIDFKEQIGKKLALTDEDHVPFKTFLTGYTNNMPKYNGVENGVDKGYAWHYDGLYDGDTKKTTNYIEVVFSPPSISETIDLQILTIRI